MRSGIKSSSSGVSFKYPFFAFVNAVRIERVKTCQISAISDVGSTALVTTSSGFFSSILLVREFGFICAEMDASRCCGEDCIFANFFLLVTFCL